MLVISSLLISLCFRALFDHAGDLEQELSFKKDDILYVDDTLPGGNLGYWLAWQLDENAQKLVRDTCPASACMSICAVHVIITGVVLQLNLKNSFF